MTIQILVAFFRDDSIIINYLKHNIKSSHLSCYFKTDIQISYILSSAGPQIHFYCVKHILSKTPLKMNICQNENITFPTKVIEESTTCSWYLQSC